MGGLVSLFTGPSAPPAPPAIPPVPVAANPPTMANSEVAMSAAGQRARAAAAAGAGFAGTVTNQGGAGGLTSPATAAPRSLLG